MRCVLLGLLAVAFCGSAGAREDKAKKPTDDELKKLLVGTWLQEEGEGAVKLKGRTTHKDDGTFEATGTLESGDAKVELAVSGTWEVKDGKLTSKVNKTSTAALIPVGYTTTDEIISVTEKEFKFKNEKGKEKTQLREEKKKK